MEIKEYEMVKREEGKTTELPVRKKENKPVPLPEIPLIPEILPFSSSTLTKS